MTSSGVECSSGSGDKTDPTVNFDDPLYVHPSDNTVTSVIIFKLLGTENFRIWRSSMVRALKARNKLGFVDGTVSKPVKDPVKESKWERANAITCSWILGSISENLYANHACLESAYDLWNELNETYHKTDGSVIFNVHQKIVSHSQDDSYNQVKSHILLMDPLPSVKTAFSLFLSLIGDNKQGLDDTSVNANMAGISCNSFIDNKCSKWVVDSGASQHMISPESHLQDSNDVSRLNIRVSHPNGSSAQINKIGNMQLSSSVTLFDVFVIPDFNDSESKGTVETGNQSVGLYYLDPYVADQFQVIVKTIRTDNGTEFINSRFKTFGDSHGIIHQTSCVYTPLQNGVLERKHRHILNVARSLMFQSGVPLKYWGDAILTSVFLINRTPSSVLKGLSPHELVYKKSPNFDNLRVFGCMCFTTNLNNSDKFSPRSEKCVFMGYSLDKKGYKVLSLDSKSIGSDPFSDDDPVISKNYVDDSVSNRTQGLDHHLDDSSLRFKEYNVPLIDGSGPSSVSSPDSSVRTEENISFIPDSSDTESIGLIRTRRETRFPSKFSDYIVEGKYKYGIEKTLNYLKLTSENKCFVSSLDKTVEPQSFYEASLNPE
ncbi:uncharacterized protein LOC111885459 [Lactuca sativa]|uniref:uncharacterized protein LOC111885459 n=1 Tax=Lactuca sativa TaxID=4236 RepID=UPI000CD8B58A|nr:uncharacterized protein LOC111885459 [Lactuca sativa]